jgi:hypothetical protein
MSDREAFEKWAKEEAKKTSRGFNELTLERDYSSPDYYAKLWVNAAWRGWQASRQALEGEPVGWIVHCPSGYKKRPHAVLRSDYNVEAPKFWVGGKPPPDATVTRLYTHPASAAVPNEHGKNRFGLDMAYFRNLFNRELNRPLTDFRPDELARVLARAARTADREVLGEAEFRTDAGIPVSGLGQRKAAQVGTTIGVLAQNKEGRVCAVTDLGRCTWLSEDVTGASNGVSWSPNWPTKPASGLGLPDAVADGLMPVSTALIKKWADVDAFNAPLGAAMELKTIAQMMLHRGKSDTYEQAVSVTNSEYIRALQDAFDIIQADANTEQNYWFLCRIGKVLAKLKAGQEQSK